jgi:phage terminase large subunit
LEDTGKGESMAKTTKIKSNNSSVNVDLGTLNPKQKLFCQSRTRYTAYGGARGGGKTHVLRVKAFGGALTYPGIRILIVRKEYPELEQNIILPMRKMVPQELASYNGSMRMMFFANGAMIKFGHYGPKDDEEYQGQEYDWIFMEEATQFTERQFRILGACLRGVNRIPKRMYLTCNPGGIGHLWVKRLFVDREYREGERDKDYSFIHATVEDNPQLMKASPEYVQMLDLMPEDVRRAWRYGDWDALSGTFFPEFRKETHVASSFVRVPAEWKKYRAFDYGLDMFACLWIAVDFEGRCYVYREVQMPNLIVSDAAKLALSLTPPHEQIMCTIAPPDMWNRQKDSGKSMAELFAENGLGLLKASNNRVQGWMSVKEMLKPMKSDTDKPGLLVTEDCRGLIRNLPVIQHDDKNPSDCATEPHDITHILDALRYFCVTRTLQPDIPSSQILYEDDDGTDYDDAMTGGEMTEDYMMYGA